MTAETKVEARAWSGVSLSELVPWWIGLCVVAAVAWTATVTCAGPMGIGPGTMGLSLVPFLVVWVVMMAAMMFPSVAPMAVVWIRSVAARPTTPKRVGGIASFLSGYLLAWATFGVGVYIVLLGVGRIAADAPDAARWVGAAIFAVAGVYQLTPLKGACLRHCRTPLGSLFHYASYKGPGRDLRVGIHHGLYCVACCWGLMIVLVAVGAMNVPVMVSLAGVILIEKVWRHGAAFSRAVGLSLLVVAALAPIIPWLLPGLLAAPMPSMSM
jgi:predicted metal-binding membrane protein